MSRVCVSALACTVLCIRVFVVRPAPHRPHWMLVGAYGHTLRRAHIDGPLFVRRSIDDIIVVHVGRYYYRNHGTIGSISNHRHRQHHRQRRRCAFEIWGQHHARTRARTHARTHARAGTRHDRILDGSCTYVCVCGCACASLCLQVGASVFNLIDIVRIAAAAAAEFA